MSICRIINCSYTLTSELPKTNRLNKLCGITNSWEFIRNSWYKSNVRPNFIFSVEFRLSHATMDSSNIKRYRIDVMDTNRSEIIQKFAYHGVCWECGPHSSYLHKTLMRIACPSAHCALSIQSNQHPLIVSNTWSMPTKFYCTCELNWDYLEFSLLKGMQRQIGKYGLATKPFKKTLNLGMTLMHSMHAK